MDMKYKMLLATAMAIASFSGYAQVDDMYFVPQKEEPKKASTVVVTYEAQHDGSEAGNDVWTAGEEPVYATGEVRDVDEYNRRGVWADDSLAVEDSTEMAGLPDSGDDYECSKRILRFCTPTIGVAVSSPLYWDLCYGPNAIYWDVYDDGVYAYAFPSSWSTFYWGYSWGWPYYSYWGWGGPWYAGWYDPWYWRPYWHYPHWGHPGPVHPGRPLARPSLTHREHSTLARGSARRGGTTYSRTRTARNNNGATWRRNSSGNTTFRPTRSGTTTRQPARNNRSTYRPSSSSSTRSSGSSFTPSSSGSSFSPSFSSPSRGGGGFSPSRSGGARGRR